MNKYKLVILVVLSLLFGDKIFAAELTAEQRKFRSSLEQFLKEEGFIPTIDDDDNSLNFKKTGVLYWISLGGSNPLYIEFHTSGLNCEDADKSLVLKSVNAANYKVRCAKAMYNETSVSFAIEMYCHSAEEFKYVFYKCLKELESIKDEVTNYYNSSSLSNQPDSSLNNSLGLLSKFFPVYGITLGQSTATNVKAKGFEVNKNDSGNQVGKVNGLYFWDFNGDDIFEHLYFTDSTTLPDKWLNLGINWNLSYNQIVSKLKNLGFTVVKTEGPTIKKYSGRNTLSANVKFKAPNENFTIELDFDYGNENNEGYTVNSANSLYSMRFKIE